MACTLADLSEFQKKKKTDCDSDADESPRAGSLALASYIENVELVENPCSSSDIRRSTLSVSMMKRSCTWCGVCVFQRRGESHEWKDETLSYLRSRISKSE